MSKRGTEHGSERISLADGTTGTEYIQLTSASVPSHVLYFEQHSFTADNQTLLFSSQRVAMRGAPWDVYRVDADGMNLVQLSDEEHPLALPVPAERNPRQIYGVRGSALLMLDIDTFEETEIARCEEVADLKSAALSADERYFFALGRLRASGTTIVARFSTDGDEVVTFCPGVPFAHMTCNHAGTTLMFRGWWEGVSTIMLCDMNGDSMRPLPFQSFAHRTWFGTRDRFQGTLLPPGHGLVHVGLNEPEPTPICAGPYFWHSGCSEDGEWIIADTNWPDIGIMLIHATNGRYAPLIVPQSASGDGQGTHGHPSFNRDASKVIYTSNRTGLPQVYICDVPDALRQELVTGELSERRRIMRP